MKKLELSDIQSLGFDVEEIYPRIFKVRNFLAADEINKVLTEAQSYTEEQWQFRYMQEMRRSCLEKFGRDDIEALVDEGLLEVTWNFADKNVGYHDEIFGEKIRIRAQEIFDTVGGIQLNGFLVIHRLYEGADLKSHYDQYSDKLIEYAAILYMNDDYTGGELFFPKLDLQIRPEPGTLMIFPGTEEYEHGVHPVGPGPVRYNFPTFAKRNHPDGDMAGWASFG
jgi:hypothetical protein